MTAGPSPAGFRKQRGIMFDEETIGAVIVIAAARGMEAAALLAVAEVESGGAAFAPVAGRREPVIRFEGHYFHRLIGSDRARAKAVAAGLASPTPGKIKNPLGQAARWAMLERAIAIDAQAARESCSWGLGQVMGSHWKWLGFGSVLDLVALARRDVAGQIELMVRFIEKSNLKGALERRDWAGFARAYNGPGYRANRYDTKMAEAHGRWVKRLAGTAAGTTAGDPVLRLGSRGDAVREAQRLLRLNHGGDVTVDGVYGAHTRDQVALVQLAAGIAGDGVVGPKTWALLRTPPVAVPGAAPVGPPSLPAPRADEAEDAMVDSIAAMIIGWISRFLGRK